MGGPISARLSFVGSERASKFRFIDGFEVATRTMKTCWLKDLDSTALEAREAYTAVGQGKDYLVALGAQRALQVDLQWSRGGEPEVGMR